MVVNHYIFVLFIMVSIFYEHNIIFCFPVAARIATGDFDWVNLTRKAAQKNTFRLISDGKCSEISEALKGTAPSILSGFCSKFRFQGRGRRGSERNVSYFRVGVSYRKNNENSSAILCLLCPPNFRCAHPHKIPQIWRNQ